MRGGRASKLPRVAAAPRNTRAQLRAQQAAGAGSICSGDAAAGAQEALAAVASEAHAAASPSAHAAAASAHALQACVWSAVGVPVDCAPAQEALPAGASEAHAAAASAHALQACVWSAFPVDCAVRILLRVPIDDRLALRAVCRAWRAWLGAEKRVWSVVRA